MKKWCSGPERETVMKETVSSLEYNMLGEDIVFNSLLGLLVSEKSFLINIYGEHGTGKTELLKQIVNSTAFQEDALYLEFSRVDCLDDTYLEKNHQKILLIDDLDSHLSRDQFRELVCTLFAHYPAVRIIFTSKNKFFLEALPAIKLYSFEIGNRTFSYQDFKTFLQEGPLSSYLGGQVIPEIILKNTFLIATYCRNFNHILEVLDAIVGIMKENRNNISPQQFLEIVTRSKFVSKLNRDLVIDTENVKNDEYLFVIRTKDKIEKLRDIILKYYPQENLLLEVMKAQFNPTYVEDAFRLNIPFPDKVLNVCLSYDPIELLVKLLGPRDIIIELDEHKIGEAAFACSIEDKAKLILKSIGLNILDEPKGIRYFRDILKKNVSLLESEKLDNMSKEYIIGLGISCYQEMENIFYEMLHFYSNYLCGSMAAFFDLYTQACNSIDPRRITFGQYIGIFSYLNRLSKDDSYQIKMLNLGKREIMPKALLGKIEQLSSLRSFYSHSLKLTDSEIPYNTYCSKINKTYSLALDIVNSIIDLNLFPEIIKIKQIIFDEFGRILYVATDWDKKEIRFSLSSTLATVDIHSHYYLLRKNKYIAVNPIIIPRLFDRGELFNNAEQYQKSSQTQISQGAKLISYLNLEDGMRILDIGCGNGKTTLELFSKNPHVTIDAFDISEGMIKSAIQNRDEARISAQKVNFFVMDALRLDVINVYDLIFSNSALHWIVDSQTMYRKIWNALKVGGMIAVHQGAYGTYRGLHAVVKKAIKELDLQMYFRNWIYPVYYPKKAELENLLDSLGFRQIRVISLETDGTEYPNLIENFVYAGMLPYLKRLPDESLRDKLRKTYFKICEQEKVDTYTHRIYAFAVKEE